MRNENWSPKPPRPWRDPLRPVCNTPLSPSATLSTIVDLFTRYGWQTTTRTPDSATFSYQTKAGCLTTIVLLALFVLPGLVYLVLAGKVHTASVTVVPDGDGTLVTFQATQSNLSRTVINQAIRDLSYMRAPEAASADG